MAPEDSIKSFNNFPLEGYRRKFWQHDTTVTHTNKGVLTTYKLSLETSATLSNENFTACFNLIASTSSADYEQSSIGWSPVKKTREMRLPDLRYILLRQKPQDETQDGTSELSGFLSFMLTHEDGHEVIYCYEVHLSPQLQGIGLGKRLIEMMEEVGKKARMEKAMLTVFKANKAAVKFYEKLGYEEDEYSPRPRKLRGGIVKEPDYMILSKSLAGDGESYDIKMEPFKKRKAR